MNVLARSLSAASLLLVLVSACGNQGAGERCDKKNQDLDCDDGLGCQVGVDPAYGLCCPLPGSGIPTPTVCYGLTGGGSSTPDAGGVGGDGAVVNESSTSGPDASEAAAAPDGGIAQ